MNTKVLLALLGVACWSTVSNAQTTTYRLAIDSGLAHTSGGIGGGGIGDLTIQGTFRLHIDPATNDAAMEDIDIRFVGHPTLPRTFDWSSLNGTINGANISLSSSSPGFGVNLLTGTFDGSSAVLAGTVRDACPDCYQYSANISASVVPEPASLSLAAIGVVVGCRRRRRLANVLPLGCE